MSKFLKLDGYNLGRRIVFMWVYLLLVCLPFVVFMVYSHDVSSVSMSSIAWFAGYSRHLIAYLILVFPFCLFLLLFLNRHFVGGKKFVNIVAVFSFALVVIGAFIPLRVYEEYAWMNMAHTVLSVGGSVIFMLIIAICLILHAVRSGAGLAVYFLFGLYVVGLFISFLVLWTAALFQLMATLSFMLIMVIVNTVSVRNHMLSTD